jgi:anti-sigma B factor antagonist
MTEVSTVPIPAPGRLEIQVEAGADGTVIALQGELDLATAPELERRLHEIDAMTRGRLLIDLSGLEFMDSTGLVVLIGAERSAQANGDRLSLRRGPNQVQRLFELAGVLDRFTFEP